MSLNTSNNNGSKGLVRVHIKSCTSTQSVVKSYCTKTNPPYHFFIIADYQSEGRGQHGSGWVSEPAKNVLMSLCFSPVKLKAERQFSIHMWSALGVVRYLDHVLNHADISIKWPNDILVNDRKIAGLLPQISIRSGRIQDIYLGVGVNLHQPMQQFPFYATSVKEETGQVFDRFSFAERLKYFITDAYKEYSHFKNWDSLQEAYHKRLWRFKREVVFIEKGEHKKGMILGVNDSGLLNMQTDDGLRTISMKEVEFLRKKIVNE